MTAGAIKQHIELIQGTDGPKARILGSRVRVLDIVIWHEKLGMSPDQIVDEHPTISLADVYAGLAYYWDHRDEIEQLIDQDRDSFIEEARAHTSILQERLSRR